MSCGAGVHAFLLPEDLDEDDPRNVLCCAGAAMRGPGSCTCWEPVYDVVQELIVEGPPETRGELCGDCAFRKDSPERRRGDDPADLGSFWCHQGVRLIVAYVHPDGRRREAHREEGVPMDYDPVKRPGLIYRADGQPGQRCAGWARANRVRP
jgi:hypothetical protein